MVSVQLSPWFKPYGVKVFSFFIQKFSLSFNLNFSVSMGVAFIFRSCSIIINLSCLSECMLIVIKMLICFYSVWFFMSFLWLFSLILNNISEFPTFWISYMTHSNKQMTLLWQVTLEKIVKRSLVWVLLNFVVLKTWWKQSDQLV